LNSIRAHLEKSDKTTHKEIPNPDEEKQELEKAKELEKYFVIIIQKSSL